VSGRWWRDMRHRSGERRLDRALARLDDLLRADATGRDTSAVAEAYGGTLLRALETNPSRAMSIFAAYDGRLGAAEKARAFGSADEPELSRIADRGEPDTLTVIVEVAMRSNLVPVRDKATGLLLPLLARCDGRRLIGVLTRLQRSNLLPPAQLAHVLEIYLERSTFEAERAAWAAFFDDVPDSVVPTSFDVLLFLDRPADAAGLADTVERRTAALRACMESQRIPDLDAGVRLAQDLDDEGARRDCAERLAEALLEAGRVDEAISYFVSEQRWDRVSVCHERVGRWQQALETCPGEDVARRGRLAERCVLRVDELVRAAEFVQAVGLAALAASVTDPGSEGAASAQATLAAVRRAGRDHYGRNQADARPADAPAVLAEWSLFEEQAGEPTEAARLAVAAGDRYRAHRLYRDAGRYGDAVRVLEDDGSERGAVARGQARAEGGDPRGAGDAYRAAGAFDLAARHYTLAGDFGAAARNWREHHGPDAAEFPDYVHCATRAGLYDELVSECASVIARKGRRTPAVEHLRELLRSRADMLDPSTAARARQVLTDASAAERDTFDHGIPAWVQRARNEVDRRYSAIWGLDLGTTTCVVAIYDLVEQRPVTCPWRGRDGFPSTLSLDAQDTEIVGLAGEDILRPGLVGVVQGSKRRMGRRTVFRIREHQYRAEEVAARLIGHGRDVVENFLARQVRERIAELARTELGEDVPPEWLDDAESDHTMRLSRSRVVITVPAYFHNNQKNATRDAGAIAGVDVVRLIHEPTAACLAVHRQRRLSDEVVVVDLGAGTLDLSHVNVGDDVFEVRSVDGDTGFGGNDFDLIVQTALEKKAGAEGLVVSSSLRRRIAVAAEQLRIRLSSQEHAEYALRGVDAGADVKLTLSRSELADLLSGALATLAATCARFRETVARDVAVAKASLVLVGGPFLSSLTRRTAEQALSMVAVGVTDPAVAVAHGAALQAAVLTGDLRDVLLLDITPLPFGIRVLGEEHEGAFSEIIAKNTTIPTTRQETFTTTTDYQSVVRIEVFQGSVTHEAKVTEFVLDGILAAPKSEPKIKVSFAIDASCVLEVTARNVQTGASKSVKVTDSTLLRPQERRSMADALDLRRRRESTRAGIREIVSDVDRLAEDGDAVVREWRTRLDTHRPTTADPDPAVRELFTEMYASGNDVETEMNHLELVLRDLAEQARRVLAHLVDEGRPEEDEALRDRLRSDVRRFLDLQAMVSSWNAALLRSITGSAEPLVDFVRWHDAGDHRKAMDALEHTDPATHSVAIVRRRLDCLAHLDRRGPYAETLRRNAPDLGIPGNPLDDPDGFLAAASPSLVHVIDAGTPIAVGFLWAKDLAVVGEPIDQPYPPAADHTVLRRAGGTAHARPVGRRFGPFRALVLTGAGAPPLRVGYVRMLGVGDQVLIASPTDTIPDLLPGVVQRLDAPEAGRFEITTDAGDRPPAGPVFTAAGEIVGMVLPDAAPHVDPGTSVVWALGDMHDLAIASGRDPWTS